MQARKIKIGLITLLLSACNFQVDKKAGAMKTMAPTFASIYNTVIKEKCIDCHNPDKFDGELDATTYDGIIKSGYIEKRNPQKSEFYTCLVKNNGWMPKRRAKLPFEATEAIRLWIEKGANERE
jgi:hypothetical protein